MAESVCQLLIKSTVYYCIDIQWWFEKCLRFVTGLHSWVYHERTACSLYLSYNRKCMMTVTHWPSTFVCEWNTESHSESHATDYLCVVITKALFPFLLGAAKRNTPRQQAHCTGSISSVADSLLLKACKGFTCTPSLIERPQHMLVKRQKLPFHISVTYTECQSANPCTGCLDSCTPVSYCRTARTYTEQYPCTACTAQYCTQQGPCTACTRQDPAALALPFLMHPPS